ncbi:MAG: hypothetical protein ACYDGR_04670 [Candidatus Dormibacteria bacterium]
MGNNRVRTIPASVGTGLVAFQGLYSFDLASIQARQGDGVAQVGLSAAAGVVLLALLLPTWRGDRRALGLAMTLQLVFMGRNQMVMTQHPTGDLAQPFHSPFLHIGIDAVALVLLGLAFRGARSVESRVGD